MIYILVIIITTGRGVSIENIEFNNQTACEIANTKLNVEIGNANPFHDYISACVEKGYSDERD